MTANPRWRYNDNGSRFSLPASFSSKKKMSLDRVVNSKETTRKVEQDSREGRKKEVEKSCGRPRNTLTLSMYGMYVDQC